MGDKKHALLSPSSAHRWLVCPGSVPFTMYIPKTTSVYAEEGTKAHDLAEKILRQEQIEPSNYDKDMLEYVQSYVDFIYMQCTANTKLYVEQALPVTCVTGEDDAVGTIDACVVGDNVLHIIDLKYGKGVRVNAIGNPQGLIYARAAYEVFKSIYNIDTIKISIVQPRLDAISTWELSLKDFLAKIDEISAKAKIITDALKANKGDDLEFCPDPHACKFCAGAGKCKAYAKKVLDIAGKGSQGVNELSADDLGFYYGQVVLVEGWLNAIKAETEDRLLHGKEVTGYKLVKGRKSPAKWTDEDKVMEALQKLNVAEQSYIKVTTKLLSPTQLEKAYKNGELEPHEWQAVTTYISEPSYAPEIAKASSTKESFDLIDTNDLPTFN